MLAVTAVAVGDIRADTNEDANEETDPRRDKIDELQEEYEAKRDAARDSDERQEYEDVLERLSLSKKLIILENAGEGSSNEARGLLAELLAHMPDTGEAVDTTATEQSSARGYNCYATTVQERDNCYEAGDDTGQVTGSITSYTNWSYLVATSHYSDEVYDGNIETCTSTDHDDTVVTFNHIVHPLLTCILTIESHDGTKCGSCGMFGTNSIILVTANAYYDGDAFKIPNAYTFVIV